MFLRVDFIFLLWNLFLQRNSSLHQVLPKGIPPLQTLEFQVENQPRAAIGSTALHLRGGLQVGQCPSRTMSKLKISVDMGGDKPDNVLLGHCPQG